MLIPRRFTSPDTDVFDTVEWSKRSSRITNADGSVVFEMNDAEIPRQWSQLATDIMVSKYFRKAGVPQETALTNRDRDEAESPAVTATGPEHSARQVIHRLAGCWTHWGKQYGYFASDEDAQSFYDELCWMLLNQVAAPNSPQWFNTGLNWAYGISGPAQGHFIADHTTGNVTLAPDAYTHPQPHACFIQAVSDDLVQDGGIMDLWVREARLFKYGSGTGTNFSSLRGEDEPLSGGGKSSGLMSFLKIGDRAAGAIKSGGTTRRAAKMVCLDADHPDIEHFINWKVREEIKVAALVEGLKQLPGDQRELAESLGLKLSYAFNGEAYMTVSGQNSNNSVRLTDAFFDAVDKDAMWPLRRRTDGVIAKEIRARDLWKQLCRAAWRCADPGVQFDSTINAWHTCPASGRINASNPCSEYMFLDNTACNLASINVLKFFDAERRTFDIAGFEHAIRLWTIVLEISVLMAAFPSEDIAERSWRYRTLGLGYANLGAMLMQAGVPYDSEEGRAICGALTAVLTGRSYATSAELASELGPFPGYADNRDAMLRVIRNHRRAAHGVGKRSAASLGDYEDLRIRPVAIDHDVLRRCGQRLSNAGEILDRAVVAWDEALALGARHGYRNAQTTVIAPTGTIGLLMDCDTTGVEPDFALTKFKKLAGGGSFKIANQSLRPALESLGYDEDETDAIVRYVMGTLNLDTPMPKSASAEQGDTFREFLTICGFSSDELVAIENNLPTVFELGMAFNAWSMPEHLLRDRRVDVEAARKDASFNGLRLLGLTRPQIEELNFAICGTQTVEGAPHLKTEHLPVFDCANRCGAIGKRFIASEGHIRMMAAAQPFISGAISKTINLPNEASNDDIASAYRLSWELGLKANALYRDGCKLSQPLSTRSEDTSADDDDDGVPAGAASDDIERDTINREVAADVANVARSITRASDSEAETIYVERIVEKIVERPLRRRLSDTRESLTHKFNVAGHEGYLIVGLYEDGGPGELFITMAKEGSTIGGLMDSLGTAISVALQYGVPLESLVKKFEHQRFEPMGMTTNRDIPFAKSLVDYIFRWMGMQFIDGYLAANAPRRANAATATPPTSNAKRAAASQKSLGEPRLTQSSHTDADIDEDQTEYPQLRPTSPTPGKPITGKSAPGRAPSDAESPGSAAAAERVRIASHANASMMGDAPACDVCGSITVRNGTCYRCLNCGNSMGCS
ncbi:MAG: adenosylcobalamin-dependent ribonucleoside-diphosphate reductase [Phycisphaerales bacterium]